MRIDQLGSAQAFVQNEMLIRIGFFLGILGILIVWEILNPRRSLKQKKSSRWFANMGLVAFNTFLLRLLFPASAVGFALMSQNNRWGLFNNIQISQFIAVLSSLLFLDLAIYAQHVFFHRNSFLWRFHKMHHADLDIDVTTGIRFHPVEIVLSMCFKFLVISILGAPVVAVLVFEIVLNGMSMFSHGNIQVSQKIDQMLRFVLVSPDMHRIHHSLHADEMNSNYGFNLSVWDRWFKTYKKEPKDGQINMLVGVR